jgi:hypothetical protein
MISHFFLYTNLRRFAPTLNMLMFGWGINSGDAGGKNKSDAELADKLDQDHDAHSPGQLERHDQEPDEFPCVHEAINAN